MWMTCCLDFCVALLLMQDEIVLKWFVCGEMASDALIYVIQMYGVEMSL
jgi:hypothetical protein